MPTPGHAKGHVSVVVRDAGISCFLAGDATYTQANLANEEVDGVTYDPALSKETLRRIKAFCRLQPTIVLPSHDPDASLRLAKRLAFAA